MTVLCDACIYSAVQSGEIGIDPFRRDHVNAASYDLMVDLSKKLMVVPGRFYLLSTVERVRVPDHLQGELHGRSSVGRLGMLVHFTAGYVDPGFDGQLTLEVMAFDKVVDICPGDRLVQISFRRLDHPAVHPYAGRYQGSSGAIGSRFQHGDQ